MEVPIKTTQLRVPKMRGSSTVSNQDHASIQATKEIEEKSSKSVNASQSSVDEHLVGSIHPVEGKPPQTQLQLAHTGWDIGTPGLTRIGKSRRVIMGA